MLHTYKRSYNKAISIVLCHKYSINFSSVLPEHKQINVSASCMYILSVYILSVLSVLCALYLVYYVYSVCIVSALEMQNLGPMARYRTQIQFKRVYIFAEPELILPASVSEGAISYRNEHWLPGSCGVRRCWSALMPSL